MIHLKRQQGVVLVTGLIFLMIALLACVSTLENTGILAYEQSNNIQKYRLFYHLESELELLEKPLLNSKFHIKDIEEILVSKNIKDSSSQFEIDFLEDIWNEESHYIERKGDILSLVEYLGDKTKAVSIDISGELFIDVCLFRVSLSSLSEQDYWLQSIVEVYSLETLEILSSYNASQQNGSASELEKESSKIPPEHQSHRIAWYERIANE